MRRNQVAIPIVLSLLIVGPLILAACNQQGAEADIAFVEIEPGLSYLDSLVGQGDAAGAQDFVLVHYTGWIWTEGAKGEKFDSSLDRDEPIAFPLGQSLVIAGWEKGVPGMKIGGKRTLLIGYEMAYGENGRPPVIPPKADLLFEIELLGLPKVDVEILEEGTGAVAENGDQVHVHYTGWLWEDGQKGKEFDSSLGRGTPFRFALGMGQVIPGWDRGVKGLKVGTKARLIIPSSLGYGPRGSGGSIPPNADLCFDVELVSIDNK